MTRLATEKRKILLVDDEPGIRRVLKITLESAGYEVLCASDGEEGISLFKKELPHIVVTDIKMPGIDGIQVLEMIKRISPETEVIMITGHGDLDLAVKSLQNEAADFITKPIDIEVLESAVKKADERTDISRKVRHYMDDLETLVREKDKKLSESQQLITIGQTIAGMSHAIKNIAGGLKGSSFILEQGIEHGNQQYLKFGWEMVKGNIDKITKLSLDLLNYAKTTRLSFRQEDPGIPAGEVFDLMTPLAAEKGIQFDYRPCKNPIPIPMDPDAIHDCLLNLVSNAIEAFKSVPEQKDKQVSLAVEITAANQVQFRVADNGPGIAPPVKEAIFRDFITTKGSHGTGFGLMTTWKIVQEHQGKIWFESLPEKGCTFYIQLPAETRTGGENGC